MNQESNSNEKGAKDANHIYRSPKLDFVKSIEARPHSSGFKSFLNWFRKVEKLEIEQNATEEFSDSSSQVSSTSSTATAASFAFLEPRVYKPYGDALQAETFIAPGPYTDTYRRLMDERERRRKLDKDITLRKKYQLYASGSTLNETLRSTKVTDYIVPEENATNTVAVYDTFSLPTMKKNNASGVEFRNKGHRRTASETKFTRPNSYVHVEGKRRAPLPPNQTERRGTTCRRKRLAPSPPVTNVSIQTKPKTSANTVEKSPVIIEAKMNGKPMQYDDNATPKKSSSSPVENTSPRFWFKRQNSDIKLKLKKSQNENNKTKSKHDFPEIVFFRNSKKHFGKSVKPDECRITTVHNLPNISELDREAGEIIQMKKQMIEENNNESEIPVFTNPNSARELISKFNAMNNAKAANKSEVVLNRSSNKDILISNSQLFLKSGLSRSTSKYTPKSNNLEALLVNNSTSSTANIQEGVTWNCKKCQFVNVENQDKMKCSKCNANKDPKNTIIVRDTDKTTLLLNSFQEEVFDALSHLGNMSNDKSNLTNKKNNPTNGKNEEQQKLREMLKEMKNSLPKRQKSMILEGKIVHPENMKGTEDTTEDSINTPNNTFDTSSGKLDDVLLSTFDNKGIKLNNNQTKRNISSEITITKQTEDNGEAESSEHKSNDINYLDNFKFYNLNNIYANIAPASPKLTKQHSETSSQTNTKAENDPKLLLKQLEKAIVSGNDFVAATIARQLALLKVSCTVLGLESSACDKEDLKTIDVYVEDQDSHHGPITLRVRTSITIGELKRSVLRELNIPMHIQKWIIGKQLAVDDDQRVDVYNDGDFTCPLFLYLVNAEMKRQKNHRMAKNIINCDEIAKTSSSGDHTKVNVESPIPPIPVIDVTKTVNLQSNSSTKKFTVSVSAGPSWNNSEKNKEVAKTLDIIKEQEAGTSTSHYNELINLDSRDLISNCEVFECSICLSECQQEAGAVLRECLHMFCKECLQNTIKFCSEAEVKCPYRDYTYSCESVLQEREIKALVSNEIYEQHLAKSVAVAENSMLKTFHCKTADCKGWCIFEDNVNQFRCPVCKHANCLTCQAIHEDENCRQYQDRLRNNENSENLDGLRTKQMLEEMVSRGDALICPSCQVVLMKKWGCDWVRCSMCKTEICWVTRGPRWGPAGKGDVTAGCQCGINGIKCHPKCNYCH